MCSATDPGNAHRGSCGNRFEMLRSLRCLRGRALSTCSLMSVVLLLSDARARQQGWSIGNFAASIGVDTHTHTLPIRYWERTLMTELCYVSETWRLLFLCSHVCQAVVTWICWWKLAYTQDMMTISLAANHGPEAFRILKKGLFTEGGSISCPVVEY